MENDKRNFVKIIYEICLEQGISIESFSYDWIFCLRSNNGKFGYIFGYQFGLNSASVHSICCDKCAASDVMTSLDIPNVEHFFFMSPSNQKYIKHNGNWNAMIALLNKYGKIVCKPNDGTGGNQVFLVSNQYELEKTVYTLFEDNRAIAISPYYDINNEYRVIVLEGAIRLIYSKQRPYVIGDGKKTLFELLRDYLTKNSTIKILTEGSIIGFDLKSIPLENEKVYLNWKHNLGQGAMAVIENDGENADKIKKIVELIINKMNVNFASIDIVECDGNLRVLEINSGLMMEQFSKQNERTYKIAKQIYKDAILSMLR